MKTKTLLTMVMLMLVTSIAGFSQIRHGKGTVEERINRRLDKMNEIVKFTGNQRNDLKVLFTDLAKKKKDAFCANEIGTDAMHDAMKKIREEGKAGIERILTKDQMTLLKEYRKSQKDKHKRDDLEKDFKDK